MAFKMKGFPMIGGTKPMKMAVKSAMKMKAEKAMKLKEEAAMKEKMNMVKGPDGKMVPDFAVDGKGPNDMKKSAKQLKEAAMKLKEGKAPMKDDRSLIQKAKDEAKQIKKGFESLIEGNPSRTRYGSSTLSQEIRDFKSGYKAEEERQAKKRTGNSAKTMKKKTPMKNEDVEAEVAAGRNKAMKKIKAAGYKGSFDDFVKLTTDQKVAIQKLGSKALSEGLNSTYINKKRNEILNPPTERTTGTSAKPMKKDAAMKLKEKPMKMKEKAAMKMGHSPKKMGHKK
jgi:hypothetical protein